MTTIATIRKGDSVSLSIDPETALDIARCLRHRIMMLPVPHDPMRRLGTERGELTLMAAQLEIASALPRGRVIHAVMWHWNALKVSAAIRWRLATRPYQVNPGERPTRADVMKLVAGQLEACGLQETTRHFTWDIDALNREGARN